MQPLQPLAVSCLGITIEHRNGLILALMAEKDKCGAILLYRQAQEGAIAKTVPDKVQKWIEKTTEASHQRLTELNQWNNGGETDHEPTTVEMEDGIRRWIQQIGEDAQLLVMGGM